MKLKQVRKPIRGGLVVKFKKLTGLYTFLSTHAVKTTMWLCLGAALPMMYLYINYKATGEVKQEVRIFCTILLVLFSLCSNFELGRNYIILLTLQIVAKFTAKTHLLLIFTEFYRILMVSTENVRRVG